MDLKEIKQVIELMKRSDLTEFEIEEEGLKLRISREGGQPVGPASQYLPGPVSHAMSAVPPAPPVQVQTAAAAESAKEDESYEIITAPMVGTFYTAPSPDSAPFVAKGAQIKKDSVVCIIEAMKVMNEIQADIGGTIVDVLVENEQAVEFGQPLYKVKPS